MSFFRKLFVRSRYSNKSTVIGDATDSSHDYRMMRSRYGKPLKIVGCGLLLSGANEYVNSRRAHGWLVSEPYWSRLSQDYRAGVWITEE